MGKWPEMVNLASLQGGSAELRYINQLEGVSSGEARTLHILVYVSVI